MPLFPKLRLGKQFPLRVGLQAHGRLLLAAPPALEHGNPSVALPPPVLLAIRSQVQVVQLPIQ